VIGNQPVRVMIKHSTITPLGWNPTFQGILSLLQRLQSIIQGWRS
jgi:hypothetical protein